MLDVSRPEISISPKCQTLAHAQRQILSGEFIPLQLLVSLRLIRIQASCYQSAQTEFGKLMRHSQYM